MLDFTQILIKLDSLKLDLPNLRYNFYKIHSKIEQMSYPTGSESLTVGTHMSAIEKQGMAHSTARHWRNSPAATSLARPKAQACS